MTTLITRTAREGRLLAALVLLAACQGDTLTAPMSPPEPPVVPGTGAVPLLANEPPGFTTLVDNDWKGFNRILHQFLQKLKEPAAVKP